jgi:class 3 adenylate cyclase
MERVRERRKKRKRKCSRLNVQHNSIVRSEIRKHRGYEVLLPRGKNTGEGSFCVAFQEPLDAVEWCCDVQRELLVARWPDRLLEHSGACEITATMSDDVVFRGPRVRMGIHRGAVRISRDPITRRMEYAGSAVDTALRITAITHGGQILASEAVCGGIKCDYACVTFSPMGMFDIREPKPLRLNEIVVDGLQRFVGGVSGPRTADSTSDSGSDNTTRTTTRSDCSIRDRVGHGLEYSEDRFLTSANLCRWVIDPKDITIGDQVGIGSYGIVYKGKWKGVEVAVKRINQKLNERTLLDFRAEMAFRPDRRHGQQRQRPRGRRERERALAHAHPPGQHQQRGLCGRVLPGHLGRLEPRSPLPLLRPLLNNLVSATQHKDRR